MAPHSMFMAPISIWYRTNDCRCRCLGFYSAAIALLVSVNAATRAHRASAEQPPLPIRQLPRNDLLVYVGSGGKLQTANSPDHWLRRRRRVLRDLQAVIGPFSQQDRNCPLDMRVDGEVDCGTYVRRFVTYASEPGSRVPAYLLIPKTVLDRPEATAPAALCLHSTDHEIGHGVVVGLGRRPNRAYAHELAIRGYVTLAPSYPLLANYQPDLDALGWQCGTAKAVWDNMRALDLLQSLPFVTTGKVAAIGHSLGGHNAVFTAVFDERIRAVVSSCGLDSFLDYYGGQTQVWEQGRGWTQHRYMPRLADYRGHVDQIPFDFHELIGALAPRPVMIVAPLHDDNFQATSVDGIAAAARRVYELYGQASRLEVAHPDGGHDFPPEMRESAYRFIDAALQ